MSILALHREAWLQLDARRRQLPHALLISGQRGIGKSELARLFAASLLCESPTVDAQACGHCMACGWLAQGNHPDFRLLQPEALAADEGETAEAGKKKPSQQITIDQVRALDDFLHVGTHRQGARVILVNPAEAMNRPTANSLLKALEEPIEGTLFLLVSSEAERLLPTIRSRCQSLPVPLPERSRSENWMLQAGVKDAAHWLALAGGSPLLAVELAQSGERELLDGLLAQWLASSTHGRPLDPLAAAAAVDRVVKADKRPAPLKRMIEWSQKWLFDLTLASQGLPPHYFMAHAKALEKLTKQTTTVNLLAFNRKTLQYKGQCEQPLNSRLFLEDFFLNYVALFPTS